MASQFEKDWEVVVEIERLLNYKINSVPSSHRLPVSRNDSCNCFFT